MFICLFAQIFPVSPTSSVFVRDIFKFYNNIFIFFTKIIFVFLKYTVYNTLKYSKMAIKHQALKVDYLFSASYHTHDLRQVTNLPSLPHFPIGLLHQHM